MSVIEWLAKTSFRVPALNERVLRVVIVAAYIFMHVVAGVMLINAAAIVVKSTPEEVQLLLQSR